MDVIVERFQRRKIVSNPASPMLYYLRQKPKTCGTVDIVRGVNHFVCKACGS